jgi:hypothetical protein
MSLLDKINTSNAPAPADNNASLFDRAKAAASLATAKAAKKDLPATSKGPKSQVSWSIQKPGRGKFHRVHPAEDHHILNLPVLTNPKDDTDYYLVPSDVEEALPEHVKALVKHIDLYAAQDHVGGQYLWPVKHGSPQWLKAGSKAVNAARKRWVSVTANMPAKTYDVAPPTNDIAEPDWSKFPAFVEMFESAFEDNVIDNPDHAIVTELMGGSEEGSSANETDN